MRDHEAVGGGWRRWEALDIAPENLSALTVVRRQVDGVAPLAGAKVESTDDLAAAHVVDVDGEEEAVLGGAPAGIAAPRGYYTAPKQGVRLSYRFCPRYAPEGRRRAVTNDHEAQRFSVGK